jgi:hypothetical protein
VRRSALILVVAVSATAGGCNETDDFAGASDGSTGASDGSTSASDGSTDSPNAAAEAVESFCLRYWTKRAEREVSCLGVPLDEGTRPAAATCARLRALALEGGVELDRERGAACLAALDIAGCGPSGVNNVRLCRDTLRGLLPANAPCRAHFGFDFPFDECGKNGVCVANWPQFECGGHCLALRLEGESCRDRDCGADFECRNSICQRIPPSGVGEPCGGPPNAPLPPCAEGLDCLAGGVCRRRDSLPSCTSAADCEDYKRCVAGTCVPNLDGPCGENDCAGDSGCFGGRCGSRRGVGQPCSELHDFLPCQPAAFCGQGMCRARGLEGQRCDGWQLCGQGTCARALECLNGVCTPPLAAGEACPFSFEAMRCCGGETACVDGRCAVVDRCH